MQRQTASPAISLVDNNDDHDDDFFASHDQDGQPFAVVPFGLLQRALEGISTVFHDDAIATMPLIAGKDTEGRHEVCSQ